MSHELKALALGVALALSGAEAQAHAHLTAADPAPNGSVSAPKAIRITFSQALTPKFSRFEVRDAKGRKVSIGPVAVDGSDNHVLAAQVPTALAPGSYTVKWRAVAGDAHAMTGQYRFRVVR